MHRLLLTILALTAATASATDVTLPTTAPNEEQVAYDELWRTDADAEDYLLGNIQSAVFDDAGALYLLDTQQQEVFRFSAEGEYLGTVVRQGEGPGEIDQVWSIGWWGPDALILPQAFPPRVVRVAPDGTPHDDLRVEREPDVAASLTNFAACGDHALVGGTTFTFDASGSEVNRWLGVIDRSGALRHLLAERSTPMASNPLEQEYDEFEAFWPWDRQAVSQDGRLFAAPERDAYVIAEYDLDGALQHRWTRPIPARKRTEEEFDRIRASRTFVFNGQKAEFEFNLSDVQPPIASLDCFGDELWVHLDQGPDAEAFARVAVHALDGSLIAERTLNVPRDEKNDVVLLLDARHVVVIENGLGAQAAQLAAFGGGEEDEELNADPIEVVVYRAVE